MLTDDEAIARRKAIEELYSTHEWSTVSDHAQALALHVLSCFDRESGAMPGVEVVELCELILRVGQTATSASWEAVKSEVKKLARQAAVAQVGPIVRYRIELRPKAARPHAIVMIVDPVAGASKRRGITRVYLGWHVDRRYGSSTPTDVVALARRLLFAHMRVRTMSDNDHQK